MENLVYIGFQIQCRMNEKKNVSLSRQCVGIDIAKQSFTACVCKLYSDDDTRKSEVCEFSNNKTGFNQMVKWSRKHLTADTPSVYLMEATGVYYESLAYHLHDKVGAHVCVVLANKAKAFAKYQDIWTKTDEMDCQVLALLGVKEPRLRMWEPPKPIYRELRSMSRLGSELTKLHTQISNQLDAVLNSAYPDKSVIGHLRGLLKDIEKREKENENAIIVKVKEDKDLLSRVERLATIRSVGISTIVTVIAETNGFELISSRKQLCSYAGFDIVERDSGTAVKGRPRISKKGNSRIRAALYFPAIVATKHNPQMKEDYVRIVAKHPDKKMIGITAIERKLLLLIYTLWKNGEEYRDDA